MMSWLKKGSKACVQATRQEAPIVEAWAAAVASEAPKLDLQATQGRAVLSTTNPSQHTLRREACRPEQARWRRIDPALV